MYQEQDIDETTPELWPMHMPQLQGLTMEQENKTLRDEIERLHLCIRAVEKKLLKEKKLKDVYLERSKVQRRELDKLNYYDEEGKLSNEKISQLVREKSRHTNKRFIVEDYEELQVAHMISQKELQEELQKEKERSAALQKELDDCKLSHENISSRYETDIAALRQQADFFSNQQEQDRQSHSVQLLVDQQLIYQLRAEKDALRQEMMLEINTLQQNAYDRERDQRKELEELQLQLNLERLGQTEIRELKEALNTCQEELKQEKDKNRRLYGDNSALHTSLQRLNDRYDTVVADIYEKCDIIHAHEIQAREQQEIIENLKTQQEAHRRRHEDELREVRESSFRRTQALSDELDIQIAVNQGLMKRRATGERPAETTSCQEETEAEPSQLEEVLPETLTVQVQEATMESACQGPSAEDLKQDSSLSEAGAVGGLQSEGEAEVSGSNSRPSAWKRFRHALGLRKPKRWKKPKKTDSGPPSASPN